MNWCQSRVVNYFWVIKADLWRHLVLVCSDDVGSHYSTLYLSMKDVYLKLLSADLRVLVYNGDTDMACNFLGDQWFVEDLGLEVWPLLFEFSLSLLNEQEDFTFKCKLLFAVNHTVPGLDVWAPNWRFLSTVWKPHFPDSEGNTFHVLSSSIVFLQTISLLFCPFSGCGSHGSSVGSRPSVSPFSVLPKKRVLLSICVAHPHSILEPVQGWRVSLKREQAARGKPHSCKGNQLWYCWKPKPNK